MTVSASLSRRRILGLACLTIGASIAGTASAQTVCLNMATLPASSKSMRKALGFEEVSSDPKKSCASCSFFNAKGAGCGTCALLSGSTVNPTSLCTSWAAKG